MQGVTKRKKIFRREDLTFQIVVLIVLILCGVYAFVFGNTLLKIIATLALAIMVVSFFSHYVLNFLYGEGYKLASALNEILYLFGGIPILFIAIGYLSVSIIVAFFPSSSEWLTPLLLAIIITLEVFGLLYLINRRSLELGRNIFQYIKYLFDLKTRA